jgi:hypothetical protein
MEVSGQQHALAILPRESLLVPTEWEGAWVGTRVGQDMLMRKTPVPAWN